MRPYILTNALGYNGAVYYSSKGDASVHVKLLDGSSKIALIHGNHQVFEDNPYMSDIDLFNYIVGFIHNGIYNIDDLKDIHIRSISDIP